MMVDIPEHFSEEGKWFDRLLEFFFARFTMEIDKYQVYRDSVRRFARQYFNNVKRFIVSESRDLTWIGVSLDKQPENRKFYHEFFEAVEKEARTRKLNVMFYIA
ncbi:MAG: hypothetical protein HC888_03120 [Candidatus Competibacteraceae bacterium]|nr:hypothetical protein [Candidatus Competibacteraceae bacterium]